MIFMIYQTDTFREYVLPKGNNLDYPVILDKNQFHIRENITLMLEISDNQWILHDSENYTMMQDNTLCKKISLEDGNIIFFQTVSGERFQGIVADIEEAFRVFQKYDISLLDYITIGKDRYSMIQYNFRDLISKNHGVIRRMAEGYYLEDYSTNGIFVNYVRVQGQVRLNFGDVINIFGLHIVFLNGIIAISSNYGNVRIAPEFLTEIKREEESIPEKTEIKKIPEKPDYFNRSPRNIPNINEDEIEIEGPPEVKAAKRKPLLFTIGPSFTMAIPMMLGCFISIFGSRSTGGSPGVYMYTGIVTAAGSAVIGVIWALMNLKYARQSEREDEQLRFDAYGNYLIETAGILKKKYNENTQALYSMYLSANECSAYDRQNVNLWNRNSTHSDFLFARLGLGDIPFQVKIKIPKESFQLRQDSLKEKPGLLFNEYKMLRNVPVGIDLREKQLWGIIGGRNKAGAVQVMYNVTAQIAAGNCYTDVKMAFVYQENSHREKERWMFAKWLPHAWSEDKKTRYVAADGLEAGDVFYEIANVIRHRSEEPGGGRKRITPKPYYILFLSDTSLLEGELLKKYIYEPRPEYGITTFIMAETYDQLPNVCEDIIQYDEHFHGFYNTMDTTGRRQPLVFDELDVYSLTAMAKRLAEIKVHEAESNAGIPGSLDFLEMYGVRKVEELQAPERWRKNRTYHTMKALIGKKAGGSGCYLDIHEKFHGPHGLIAGTTGSGKSETLQTYMLSLALNFSPDDIGFFVIDFKGGGMANLFSGLPHMIGQISNLSGNQIRRAMISIKSENKRRQRIFGEYGVNNINLYTRLYKNNETTVPIPHLFIIIDEFAELKREEPDFMRELISVAQVGRSLGVHLILATQKPNGTVDDNIWSNSKFRLCLRVQDRQDSNDMLHKPDAAFITQAGRGYLQVGNDEIYELFQSGWSGAVYDETGQDYPGELAAMLTGTGKAAIVGRRARIKRKEQENIRKRAALENVRLPEPEERTQLSAVVEYLKKTARENGYTHKFQLWLPVLPGELYFESVAEDKSRFFDGHCWESDRSVWKLEVPVGLFDDPENQSQAPLLVNFSEGGHLAVCGTVFSGKSTFLQTLLYALCMKYSPDEIHIYGLDFSSGLLMPFGKMPHSGGILNENDMEDIGKLFHMLGTVIDKRKKLLGGGNYAQYIKAYGVKLPAIFLVIDNYSDFAEKTENIYAEIMLRLSKEGVGYGIFLVLSSAGYGMAEIPNRIADNIKTTICLELGDKFKYMELMHMSHIPVLPEADIRGRGLAAVGGTLLEFQTALSLKAEDDYGRIKLISGLAEEMSRAWTGKCARKIPRIPQNPVLSEFHRLEEVQKLRETQDRIPVAYYHKDASVYAIPLKKTYCYCISGKTKTGKTSLLKLIIEESAHKNGKLAVFEKGNGELEHIASTCNAEYISDDEGLFRFFKNLLPEFARRNKRKQSFIADGMDEEEIYEKMQTEQQIFIFIADLTSFMNSVYRPESGVGVMKGFVENILAKGELHNIFFFGVINSDDAAGISTCQAFRSFAAYRRGVHLGGNITAQRLFTFQNISFTEAGKAMKRGIGIVPSEEEETNGEKIIIPMYGK